ncbi:MAG TPA: DNA polymerase III subunit gamma/tau [Casimicrobiaceae bacterium]
MSYQVLARKWRPKAFAELTGQEHVVTALANALSNGRLHHAYLLTGTRGVGKTTIARILAKSLNCERGVSATPCGECGACRDIDAGRFVDLLELDAASNTGIDNMREILDNARYAATAGRYKVYLIDEVHMLSKAAFNSMLKTLEEPPEHVKFVLATTDPQKIPITVLSRCLQFNLKPLGPELVARRLAEILHAEGVEHDAASVDLIARAAQGSMRDGLSLLDQAIAYGGGRLEESVVRAMLGVVDREFLYRIVDALASNDGAALLAEADALGGRGLSLSSALDELASLFHRMAVAQTVPAAAAHFDDSARVIDAAARFAPDTVQLAYQICVQGRTDLPLAPDERTGFAMTLLRLLAFEPAKGGAQTAAPGTSSAGSARATAPARAAAAPAPARAAASTPVRSTASPGASNVASLRPAADSASRASAPPRPHAAPAQPLPTPEEWPAFVVALKLTGMAAQLAAQSELRAVDGNALTLALPTSHRHLADKAYADKLKTSLEAAVGRRLLLAFEVGETTDASLAAQERRERAEAKAKGEQAFREEPFVRDLLTRFDGRIKSDTVEPLPASNPPPSQDSAP